MGRTLLQRTPSRRKPDSTDDLQRQRNAVNQRAPKTTTARAGAGQSDPVRRRDSAPATQLQPAPRSSLSLNSDPLMDAAHRGVAPAAAQHRDLVQRKQDSAQPAVQRDELDSGQERAKPADPEELSWFRSTVERSQTALSTAEDLLSRYEDARSAIHREYGDWVSGSAQRGATNEFKTFESDYLARCHSIAEAAPVPADEIRTDVTVCRTLQDLIEQNYEASVATYQLAPGVPAFEAAQQRWELAEQQLKNILERNIESAKNATFAEATLRRGRSEFSTNMNYSGVAIDPMVDVALTSMQAEVTAYLANKIGANGANMFRSRPLRSFRGRLKNAARDQAISDIDAREDGATATSDFVKTDAKPRVYKAAKATVNKYLHERAEAQAAQIVERQRSGITSAGNNAALAVLASGNETATQAAQRAIRQAAKTAKAAALEEAKGWKADLVNNPVAAQGEARQVAEEQGVRDQTTRDGVGQKALEQSLTANTTDEGLGKIGQLIDRTLRQPGDQASLKIELQVPIGHTPGFVSLAIEGTAARGIDGAVTAGVPILGDNPEHMEAMFKFSLGAGVEAFGLRADGSIGFFLRSGGQDTSAAMKAMSYAAYRAAGGISGRFADWWAGSTKGTGRSKRHKAESWAAMIEEQVFDADASAFADQGVSGSLGAKADIGLVSASAALSGAHFRRWNQDNLKENLGADFAKPVASEEAAQARRARAVGASGTSLGGAVSVSVDILGQGVDFAASLSGSANDFANNWGLEITSGVSLPPGADATKFAEIAAGIVAGSLSAAKAMSAIVKGNKAAGGLDLAGDAAVITNAGMANQLSTYLAELSAADARTGASIGGEVGSSIQVAVLLGRGGGEGIFRVELRSSKSAQVKIGLGNVGLSGGITHTQRIGAIGYEQGQVRGELLGNRT